MKFQPKVQIISGCLILILGTFFMFRQVALFSNSKSEKVKSINPHRNTSVDIMLVKAATYKGYFSSNSLDQEPVDPKIKSTFKEAASKHADKYKNIAISLLDYGFLDLAVNLLLTYKNVNLTNYLLVSSDNQSCGALAEVPQLAGNIACVHYVFDADAAETSSFGSSAFVRKTHRKTKIVLDALLLQFNVLLVDVDIVFFKNPFPYLEKCGNCDLQVQWDHGTSCSGFYFVRATQAGIDLMKASWQKTLNNPSGINDQLSLNSAMKVMKSVDSYKQLILPQKEFSSGLAYFHNQKIMFATDGPYPPNVYMVHNNWIISGAAKIYRFKESLMWFNNRGGYYSDPTRKYLFYDNAIIDTDQVHQLEMEALKSAFIIGHVLNRTVILPSFSCRGCNAKSFPVCGVKSNRCSLHSRYKIKTFDAALSGLYREHVFLLHPLVPSAVVQSKTETFLIESWLNKKYTSGRNITTDKVVRKLEPKEPSGGANGAEIVNWFRGYDHISVLMFDTLYGVVNMTAAESVFKGITEKLNSAFHKSDYIQHQ